MQKDARFKASIDQFLSFYRENRELLVSLFSAQGDPLSQLFGAQDAPTKQDDPSSQSFYTQDAAQGDPSAPKVAPSSDATPDLNVLEEYLHRVNR